MFFTVDGCGTSGRVKLQEVLPHRFGKLFVGSPLGNSAEHIGSQKEEGAFMNGRYAQVVCFCCCEKRVNGLYLFRIKAGLLILFCFLPAVFLWQFVRYCCRQISPEFKFYDFMLWIGFVSSGFRIDAFVCRVVDSSVGWWNEHQGNQTFFPIDFNVFFLFGLMLAQSNGTNLQL